MKNKTIQKIIIISMVIIILSGCAKDEKIDKNFPDAEENNLTMIEDNKELSGTLTVTTFYDGYIDIHAKNFMDMHPNVDIQIIRPDEDEFETWEGYANRVAVEIITGKSCDLVDLSSLDVNQYADSGLLCNLYDFMDSDSLFNKSDYYNNIFKALEYDNKLYAMPFTFFYHMVYASKPMAERLELDLTEQGIDYKEMIEIYMKAKEYHPYPQNFELMPGAVKESFFNYEVIEFYNPENKTVWVDGEDFIKHLKVTKDIYTGYSPDNPGGWRMTRIANGNDDFMKSNYMFSKIESNAIDLYNMMIEYENASNPPIPLLNSAGNSPFTTTFSSMYVIPEGSSNKELAWEFLKYCISEKDILDFENEEEEMLYFMMYQGWIPINIKNFYTSFRYNFENEIEFIEKEGFDVKWKSDNKEDLINETLDLINKWNLERNKLISDFEFWTLLESDLRNYYYYDLATAEETAKIIQNKVSTYLNE